MAKIVSGFMRQKCMWTRVKAGTDVYGKPNLAVPVEIKCRWVLNSGWKPGIMGAGTGDLYDHIVTTVHGIKPGDLLYYTDPETNVVVGGPVGKVTTIINAVGKEEGRICYV